MSIGFLGAGIGTKIVDLYGGGAATTIDVSLQNVLHKYDSIRTDLDRLADSASQGTFDLTSRAHYNNYLKEAQNGWAEAWYAEYRAVLTLRADSLQKKLQASYNRVLEKAAYAELKNDTNSVFAPYANRTSSQTDVTNKMPASKIFTQDVLIASTGGTPEAPEAESVDPYVPFYTASNYESKVRSYILNGRTGVIDGNGEALDDLVAQPPGTLSKDWHPDFSFDWVTGQDDEDARDAQIRWTIEAIQDAQGGNPPGSVVPSLRMVVGPDTFLNMPPGGAALGATSIVVQNGAAAGLVVGKTIDINGQVRKITSVSADGNTIGFFDASLPEVINPLTQAVIAGSNGGLTKKVSDGVVVDGPNMTQQEYDRAFDSMVESALKTTSNNLEALRDTQPGEDPDKTDLRDDEDTAHWVRGQGNSPDYGKNNSGRYYGEEESIANHLEGGYRLKAAREKSDRISTEADEPFYPIGTLIKKYDIKKDKFGNTMYLWNDGSYYDSALGAALQLNPNAPKQTGGSGGIPGMASALEGIYSEDTSLGFPMLQIPMFGTGELGSINLGDYIPQNIKDTLEPGGMEAIAAGVNNQLGFIKNIFVGRQYDDIIMGNKYEDTNAQVSLGLYPVITRDAILRVDAMNKSGSLIMSGARGKIDPIKFQVSFSIFGVQIDLEFAIAIGPDVYYGHTSAMSNLSTEKDLNFNTADPLAAAIKVMATNPIELPQIGFGGFVFGIKIAKVPILAMSLSFSYDIINKIMTDVMKNLKQLMVEAMQVQSYAASSGTAFDSYASRAEYHMTQPGFSEVLKAMALTFDFGLFKLTLDFGSMFNAILFDGLTDVFGNNTPSPFDDGILTLGSQTQDKINGVEAKDRLFAYQNSVQGAETRETETGGFFATSAFLSQFELSKLDSEYWIGTQQNEELVNMDFARLMTGAGKELVQTIIKGLGLITVGREGPTLSAAAKAAAAAIEALTAFQNDARFTAMMYDLLYRDQNTKGRIPFASILPTMDTPYFDNALYTGVDMLDTKATTANSPVATLAGLLVPRIPIVRSTFKSEAYDYIESDHKPFEGDSDFNYAPSSGPLSYLTGLFNSGTPDFILDGYANTRRFVTTANDDDLSSGDLTYDKKAAGGVGPRGQAGGGGQNGNPDGIFWNDTPMGDINEVYVGTRKVSFTDLTYGFGEFTNASLTSDLITDTGATNGGQANGLFTSKRVTEASLERYVGVDSRIYGRRYDAADPVSHETFNSGMYSSLYGGEKEHYDRVNQYSMNFTTKADGNKTNLFGAAALNPTFGGFIKMAEIDANKSDTSLLEYENINPATMKVWKPTDPGYVARTANTIRNIDPTRVALSGANDQKFGAAADETLNDFNKTLYECLHLRSDGKNLSTIKDYRDVFDSGLLRNIFISGATYHPSGGGITSSIEVRFDRNGSTTPVQTNTREYSDAGDDPYNTLFQNKTRGKATVFLNTYFAYKKRAGNRKT